MPSPAAAQPDVPVVGGGVDEPVGVGVGLGVDVGVGVGVGVGVVGVGVGVGDGSWPGRGDWPGLRSGDGDGDGDSDGTVVADLRIVARPGIVAWVPPCRAPSEACLRPDCAWAATGGLAAGAAVTDGTAGASADAMGGVA
jgi:hypothetical protein